MACNPNMARPDARRAADRARDPLWAALLVHTSGRAARPDQGAVRAHSGGDRRGGQAARGALQ
eukprot:6089140-Prymnesium_polylepis.2